jgi:UDP-glucose 4-epimerase
MNILVTGGAGYIGSNLVDQLVGSGHTVSVLDDLSTGKRSNLSSSMNDIEFVEGSILDEEVVRREVGRVELVYHLAAAVGVGNIVAEPLQSIITNSRGTENVLDACFKTGAQVVVASTSEIYGKSAKLPMCEDDDRVLGSTRINRWSYSTAKALDEHLAFAYAEQGLAMSIIRYFNSYGPRIDEKGYGSVVANFLRQALANEPLTVHGSGEQTRCFTYVEDSVRGTILAASTPAAKSGVFNIGNNVEMTINDLAKMVIAETNSSSTIQHISHDERYGAGFEDTKRRVPDMNRAKTVLDYEPHTDFATGLNKTIAWWTSNLS